MLRAYKISPVVMFGVITAIAATEVAAGTGVFFVCMVVLALFAAGTTYNLLGGLSRLGGMLFAVFALRTIVVSQIGKVVLFERADQPLEAPATTISLYALFFVMVMAAVFLYSRTRIALPKPLEPVTRGHARVLYFISVLVGGIATAVFDYYSLDKNHEELNNAHSVGLAFSGLLLFSIVVAVDSRIRETNGRHSWDWMVTVPTALSWISAFFFTSRAGFLQPIVAYFAACYIRGYRFRRRHFVFGGLVAIVFVAIVSPFELYSRSVLENLSVGDRVRQAFYLLAHPPTRADILAIQRNDEDAASGRGNYFEQSGTMVLNRFALIRPDSDVIGACSRGFHYGFTTVRNDLLINVPHFLYPDKPEENSAAFVGRVSGLNPDKIENSFASFTPIADSYGGFGWLGVMVFGFFVFPLLFTVCESVFDVSRPWGTVALGMLIPSFGESSLGSYLAQIVKVPLYLILLSWVVGGIARMLPLAGDKNLWSEVPLIPDVDHEIPGFSS